MKETLEIINQMQADGVIGSYAIGGAVAAVFYLEPMDTLDIDIFTLFPDSSNNKLISLSPIFNYLKTRGHEINGEYISLGGWPVQFLPPGDALGEEALAEAIETNVEDVPTRVLTAEHLVALALQLGRTKDKMRIIQFIEAGVLDNDKLNAILSRHRLFEKWEHFRYKYIEDSS